MEKDKKFIPWLEHTLSSGKKSPLKHAMASPEWPSLPFTCLSGRGRWELKRGIATLEQLSRLFMCSSGCDVRLGVDDGI